MRIPTRNPRLGLALSLAAALALAASLLEPERGAPAGTEPWHEIASNDGTFLVRYRTTPAIELGLDFDVEVEVALAGGGALPGDLELRIDGDMPEHGHGLLHLPRTERLSQERFRARELRFFMPGSWELYFDLTHGALTERAQAGVVLD